MNRELPEINGHLDHETVKRTIKKIVTTGFQARKEQARKEGSQGANPNVDGGVEETPGKDPLHLRPRRETVLQTFTTCEKNRPGD